MAITRNDPSGNPTAIRAEELGERLGRSLAKARHRFEATARPPEVETARRPEEDVAPEHPATGSHLVHRADELVTRLEHGFVAYATVLRDRLRRIAARMREEAEDVAAEAAHIRETRAAAEPHGDQSNRHQGEPAA
jgi:hypothetical protein